MTTEKQTDKSPLLMLILIALGIYLVYIVLVFLANCFVYFGFNFFMFIDNLFQITFFNPVIVWGIFGLFIGSAIGIMISIKKYKLSKKLIWYPVSLLIALFILFYFINRPGN